MNCRSVSLKPDHSKLGMNQNDTKPIAHRNIAEWFYDAMSLMQVTETHKEQHAETNRMETENKL